MDKVSDTFARATDRLKAALPSGVELELLAFDPKLLDDSPFLQLRPRGYREPMIVPGGGTRGL